MIIRVRHELTSADLAHALALYAETTVGSSGRLRACISVQGKKAVREIARARVEEQGRSDCWPDVLEDGLLDYARRHIDDLWPKGA